MNRTGPCRGDLAGKCQAEGCIVFCEPGNMEVKFRFFKHETHSHMVISKQAIQFSFVEIGTLLPELNGKIY